MNKCLSAISCPPLTVSDGVLVNGDLDQSTSGSVYCNFSFFTEISCPKPPLAHFQVEGDKTVYKKDEVLRYSCDRGYKKVDGRPSLCKKQGQSAQWTPTPQCEVITCKLDPNPPVDTTYNPRNQMVFRPGQSVRVSCGEKQWVKDRDTHIPNGFAHERQNKLYYTCNEGYKLLTKGWWGVASCEEGEWKTSECVADTDCGPVPDIPNLSVTSDRPRFSDGDTFPIKCEAGHQNLHPDLLELTCSRGKWTSNNVPFEQICTRKLLECYVLLTYNCREKFVMEGNSTIQCINGIWEQKSISCKVYLHILNVVFSNRENFTNALVMHFGEVLLHVCKRLWCPPPPRRFFFRSHQCLSNLQTPRPFYMGTFSLLLGCARPPALKNGYVLNNSSYFYVNGDKVRYQCDHLYELEGRPYKTCSNGQWIGDLQCLKTELMPDNATLA
uniref:Sushi domain-containing protein n=1 Tax=Neogobius melanostomus TaxID=47308 RepID=A0A8C6T330_9GOBI